MRAGKPSLPRLSYDKTRLRVEPEEKVLPLRLASHGEENPENCGRGHGCQHRPGASCASVARRTILGAKTRFQLRPDRLEGGSIADRKSTRLNSSHDQISYAVFCLKK